MWKEILEIFLGIARLVIGFANLIAFERKHDKGDTHGMLYNAIWVILAFHIL